MTIRPIAQELVDDEYADVQVMRRKSRQTRLQSQCFVLEKCDGGRL